MHITSKPLLAAGLFLGLAAAGTTQAGMPKQLYPDHTRSDQFQDAPQGAEHWDVFAREEAQRIAKALKESQAGPVSIQRPALVTPFETVFFDYLVSALHEQGVDLVAHGSGAAQIHVHSQLIHHAQHRRAHRLPYEVTQGKRPLGRKVLELELALHVRVTQQGQVAFANSKTFYVHGYDMDLFKPALDAPTHARRVPVLGE